VRLEHAGDARVARNVRAEMVGEVQVRLEHAGGRRASTPAGDVGLARNVRSERSGRFK